MSAMPSPAQCRPPSVKQAPQPQSHLWTSLFLGTCWSGMVLAGLWLLVWNGISMPWRDDYGYITPILIGDKPPTVGWLGELFGDYRIPFAKVMNLALLQVSGWEFRTAAVWNILALGMIAFGLMWAAARIRGRPSFGDGVFPIILLSWSDWDNIIWSLMLTFVLAHVVLLSLLMLVATRFRTHSIADALLVGGGVALLPVLGPSTVAYVPALTVWLGFLCVILWRNPRQHSKVTAVALASCMATALALLVSYLAHYDMSSLLLVHNEETQDTTAMERVLSGLVRMTSMALATDKVSFWGLDRGYGPLWFYLGAALLSFHISTAALLCLVWWRRPAERVRAAGLLSFLGGAFCLLLSVCKFRGFGDDILTGTRYAIFAMPPLFCGILSWLLYGPRWATGLFQPAILGTVCVLLPLNLDYGWRATSEVRQQLQMLADDLGSGKPAQVLANHYCGQVLLLLGVSEIDQAFEAHLAKQFRGFRDRKYPPFDRMAPDPEVETIWLDAATPTAFENVEWDGIQAVGQGRGACLTFLLPKSRYVLGARLTYTLTLQSLPTPPRCGQVDWRFGSDGEEHAAPLGLALPPHLVSHEGKSSWIWINDRIDRLRVQPSDGPFVFRLHELTLLIPKRKMKDGE